MLKLTVFLNLTLLFIHTATAQPTKVEGYATANSSYITHFDGYHFTVQRKDGYAVIDLKGNVITSGIKAPVIGFFRKLPMYHGTLFADEAGNIVLKSIKGKPLGIGKYQEIIPFTTNNTVARVAGTPGSWTVAYLDTSGKEIVRFDVKKYLAIAQPLSKMGAFSFVSLNQFLPFSEGLTPIHSAVSEKYGFIDKKLKLVIPVSFKQACPFSDGLAAVQNNDGNWGFINKTGRLVIPYTYSRRPSRFMSGLARVENNNGRWGYINKENKVVITPKYQFTSSFYKGYALVRESQNHPVLLIDSTGKTVTTFPKDASYIDNATPPAGISGGERPEYPFYVSETLQQLVDEGKGIFTSGLRYGLIDNKGNRVLDFEYQILSDYHGGKMFAHKSAYVNNSTQHQYGILNDRGSWVIEIVKPEF